MFLSLNIHEALTFETEICLHPDLFTSTSGTSNTTNNNNTNNSNNNNADAGTIASARHSTLGAPPSATAVETNSTPLQAGDFIEIRVWDGPTTTPGGGGAHPASVAATSHYSIPTSASLPFRRPSPPPHDDNLKSSTSISPQQQQQTDEVDSVTSSNDPLRSSSFQGGTITPTLTPQQSPHPTEEKVVNGNLSGAAALPPPFPRGRALTVEGGGGGAVNTKPPRATTASTTAATNTTNAATTNTTSRPVRHSPKLANQKTMSRHVREISDISSDTTVLWGDNWNKVITASTSGGPFTTLDTTHQLVDLQVPFGASADEETETSSFPSHTLRLNFFMLVTEASLTSLKTSARTQVSLLRQVADLYNLSSYDIVSVHRVPDSEVEKVRQQMAAEFVLVTIKDQYLSRGDLHFFQQSLQGSFLYEGQRLQDTTRGIQAHAREIRLAEHVAPTGIVTEHTKIAYRSRSSRIFWLVQMSAEMWDYSAPFAEEGRCEVYFDKFMAFVYELFEKWKSVEVTHSLTVVFFSRTFFNATNPAVRDKGASVQKDVFGRYYEDHCRLVIENETRADWGTLILQIREAFWRYPQEVGWNLSPDESGCWPSSAGQGNVLEAINVTLNLLQFHYLDRDLHRTGNSIVVVSAGNGVFEVSKELSQITYQRMMDNGIGSDMVSLGLPPLHTAPFFMYVKEHQAVGADGVDSSESYFEVPHWMHLSFVSYESDTRLPTVKTTKDDEGLDNTTMPRGRIEIGPNGFIRRHWLDGVPKASTPSEGQLSPRQTTATPGMTTFVASPVKQRLEMPKERQLIAGRDFSDILRASRPRFSASLPNAFKMLLKSQGRERSSLNRSHDDSVATNLSGSKSVHIREWNSMESDDGSDGSIHIRGRGVSLGTDPRDGTSPVLLPKSPPRVDVLDMLDRGSPASSFNTHLSGALGSSLERKYDFMPQSMSPKISGVQLQRARSLELDTEENEESETIESERSLFSTYATDRMEDTDAKRFLDSLRVLMKASDAGTLKVESPKLIPQPALDKSRHSSTDMTAGRQYRTANLSKSPVFGPRNISGRTLLTQQASATSGGIGAALSQYRPGSATSLSSDTDASTNISRVSSYGRIHNNALLRIPEMISAGMSPLLLPPSQPGHDNAETGRVDSRLIPPERRFGDSQRIGSMDASYIRPSRVRQDSNSGADRRLQSLTSSSPPRPPGVNLGNIPSNPSRRSSAKTSKKKKAFNPFRQQDEDAVLAEKSHNRRRWSHVFPATEVEFKRHAGPNWKSLSAPAILPISVDYFPPQAKIDLNFRISQYSINVSDFEHRNFSSTKFLLMEMVRQRITQDFQVVPRSNVNASNYRKEWLSRQVVFDEMPDSPEEDQGDPLRMFLSMGHRLQVLSYVPSADTVHVTQYTEKASADEQIYKYHYMSYSQQTKSFVKNVQSFSKYASPYNWNKVDRILSGDSDRELREGMRVKRLMFILIPETLSSTDSEEKYVGKFKRLLDYFGKLRPKEEAETPLNVRIITSSYKSDDEDDDPFDSTPGIEGKSMVRFYVPLRKGRVDQFEYTELSMDATFNTAWSYRIIVNWLSASTTKIEAQIQSLQRRCTQYGLALTVAPQLSVARNVFLNPFRAPALFSIRDRFKVPMLYVRLTATDYVHDGVFPTEATNIAECIEGGSDFKFRRWGKLPHGRQFVHRSGTLFVRIVVDRQGWALIVAFANYRLVGKDSAVQAKCSSMLRDLGGMIKSLDG
eukprot:scaffold568_cov160-Amphora_coffeaeformis.AAC.4